MPCSQVPSDHFSTCKCHLILAITRWAFLRESQDKTPIPQICVADINCDYQTGSWSNWGRRGNKHWAPLPSSVQCPWHRRDRSVWESRTPEKAGSMISGKILISDFAAEPGTHALALCGPLHVIHHHIRCPSYLQILLGTITLTSSHLPLPALYSPWQRYPWLPELFDGECPGARLSAGRGSPGAHGPGYWECCWRH